jgi:Uma2 family endonuclease
MATTVQLQKPRTRRFTVDEYYKMAEVGILRPDERVQLIDGEIVEMPPEGPGHSSHIDRLNDVFWPRFSGAAVVRIQHPVQLGVGSMPEPDVALALRPTERALPYLTRHPGPNEILLAVEVADSSLAFDLGAKSLDYARHNIPDLWVLDLRGDRLVVHRDPTPTGYANVTEFRRGDSVAPLAFPEATIPVDELLG